MKTEQLTTLGISTELAEKVLSLHKEEVKNMIPRFRYDEMKEKHDGLVTQLATANDKIKELAKFEGTNTELQTKITTIQSELATKETEYKAKLGELSKKNLIKVALLSEEKRPYDVDIVLNLLQPDKITLDANSEKIISGYQEQIKELQISKPFLFSVGAGSPQPSGTTPPDGNQPPSGEDKFISFGKSLAAAQLRSMGITPKK